MCMRCTCSVACACAHIVGVGEGYFRCVLTLFTLFPETGLLTAPVAGLRQQFSGLPPLFIAPEFGLAFIFLVFVLGPELLLVLFYLLSLSFPSTLLCFQIFLFYFLNFMCMGIWLHISL